MPVHMNHFLMAHLGFEEYRFGFEKTLQDLGLWWATERGDGICRQPEHLSAGYEGSRAVQISIQFCFACSNPRSRSKDAL